MISELSKKVPVLATHVASYNVLHVYYKLVTACNAHTIIIVHDLYMYLSR